MAGQSDTMTSDVFITGAGIVSPAGVTAPETWSHILSKTSYISIKDLIPSEIKKSYKASLSSETHIIDPSPCVGAVGGFHSPSGTEDADRATQLAVAAADEAVTQARLGPDDFAAFGPDRCRVSIGTSKGGVITLGQAFANLEERRQGGDNGIGEQLRIALGEILPDGAARRVADRFGITGGAHATVAACATGTLAVIQAARWIQAGQADIVLAGSSDASLTPLWFGAFRRMGVLARPHPTLGPGYACRPFDRTREGFVIGEGAAVLVLESRRSANRRGAKPLARIAGFSAGSDPAGLTAITPDAESLANVLRLTLRRGGYKPEDIAAVFAHGTATLANDAAEIQALLRALGQQASKAPIVSVKGAIGHLLGAAGAVETALSALAVFHRRLPGNSTLIEPDPALGNLNLPREAIDLSPGPVLKVSMGFGGHLGAMLLAPV